MCKNAGGVDWNDLKYLLALKRAGTLAGAARELGVDHSTVSRRLAALEEGIGSQLLRRTPEGLCFTEAGNHAARTAEAMDASASSLLSKLAGEEAVRQERVGPPPARPQVQQRQAVRGRGVTQVLRDPVERAGAVLALEVLGEADALERDGGVQFERGEPPVQLGGLIAELIQRFAPARRADIAPRSDDVGPDDDVDHGLLLVTCGRTVGAFPGGRRDSPAGRRGAFGGRVRSRSRTSPATPTGATDHGRG